MSGHQGSRIDGVRRIAVLRANGIGDLVFALPALEAVRVTYPEARVTLLGTTWHAELLGRRPGPVDEVVALPPIAGVTAPPPASADRATAGDQQPPGADAAAATAARARHPALDSLRSERFDLAIQLHGGGRYSNLLTRELGARVAIGFRARDAAPLDRWVRYRYFQPEVLRYLEVVALAGVRPVTVLPRLAVTVDDRRALDEAVARVAPSTAHAGGWPGDGRPLVVVNPAAGDARRRWPAPHFARVADRLAARGATIVISGGPGDRPVAAAVVDAMRHRAVDLAGRLSLPALVGLLDRADLLVSNDSGPLHVAAAVGTATVGVYWIGNLINAGPPATDRHRAVTSWRVHCPVCGEANVSTRCRHDASFVADVDVDEVTDEAIDLLDLPAGRIDTGSTTSGDPLDHRIDGESTGSGDSVDPDPTAISSNRATG